MMVEMKVLLDVPAGKYRNVHTGEVKEFHHKKLQDGVRIYDVHEEPDGTRWEDNFFVHWEKVS